MDKGLLSFQKGEITEHFIYKKLSESFKGNNKKILKEISDDELKHYNTWKKYTNRDVKPDKLEILKYQLISKLFGITFGIKLMEKGEKSAQVKYLKTSKIGAKIIKDEKKHEKALISLVDEEKLKYVGAMVLGLNDALVELTGALAGFTFALNNTKIIAMTGLITGIAASLSMAASEYLSTKAEESGKNPLKASFYTGLIYLFAVLLLIFPYLLLDNIYFSLGLTILNAILLIVVFTFYISVAKELSFKKRFLEMAPVTLGIVGLTFLIGYLVKIFFNIEI